jgi:hypothetical protein
MNPPQTLNLSGVQKTVSHGADKEQALVTGQGW